MPRFRFSLFRLFMAVTVFCGAFAFVKMIGAPWPICPWLIGVPMALLMLVMKPGDKKAILVNLEICGIGSLVGLVIADAMIRDMRDGGPQTALYPTMALVIVVLIYSLMFFVHLIITMTKLRSDRENNYWEEWDAKARTGKLAEVSPTHPRKLHHDQAGTQAD